MQPDNEEWKQIWDGNKAKADAARKPALKPATKTAATARPAGTAAAKAELLNRNESCWYHFVDHKGTKVLERRNLTSELTFIQWVLLQTSVCYFTGGVDNAKGRNSVDRLNNALGYTFSDGNCNGVKLTVNIAKGPAPSNVYLKRCMQILFWMMRICPDEMHIAVNRGIREAIEELNESITELVQVDDSTANLSACVNKLTTYVNTYLSSENEMKVTDGSCNSLVIVILELIKAFVCILKSVDPSAELTDEYNTVFYGFLASINGLESSIDQLSSYQGTGHFKSDDMIDSLCCLHHYAAVLSNSIEKENTKKHMYYIGDIDIVRAKHSALLVGRRKDPEKAKILKAIRKDRPFRLNEYATLDKTIVDTFVGIKTSSTLNQLIRVLNLIAALVESMVLCVGFHTKQYDLRDWTNALGNSIGSSLAEVRIYIHASDCLFTSLIIYIFACFKIMTDSNKV